jgi:raffinose/stachyose/melibiose transport system substrate-binding protein
MNKMKKLFCFSIALLLVVSVSAIWAGGEQEAEKVEEKVALQMWSWRPEDVEEYNQILAEFESSNPDFDVTFKPFKNTDYPAILLTALEGGEGPDIMQLKSYGGLQVYTKYLVALEDKIPALRDFSETALSGARGREDNKIYGVPFATQGLGIYNNKKIFEEHGLTVPSTWSEFIETCKTLKESGAMPFANGGKDGWTLEVNFGVLGPNYYGANEFFEQVTNGDTTFTDPRFVKALEKTLEIKPYMPPGFMGVGYPDQRALFYNEQAAMYIGGAWEIGGFKRENPSIEFDIFPGPPEAAGETAYISGFCDGSYGMNKDTAHPAAAVEFLKFIASPEFGQRFSDLLAQLSTVPGVDPKDPQQKKFIELSENSTPYVMLVGFRWEEPSGSVVLQSNLQEMFQGTMSPEEVAAKVQEALEEWYEPFQ